jgi:DNA-binding transcriptional MerR regulator
VTSVSTPRTRLGIGEVLRELREDFPEVSISKIRFLEAAGLVTPERTASGYRKFSRADVDRLRYVLRAQQERYLPLKVIKTHLDAIERGLEPGEGEGRPRVPQAVLESAEEVSADAFTGSGPDVRLSRDELLEAAEIDDRLLAQLEGYGLVRQRAGSEHFDGDAVVVAMTARELAAFGLEARHLRVFKTAADRELGLCEQVVAPLRRHRDERTKARADEVSAQLAAAAVRLHAALVKTGLRATQ